MTTTNVFSGFGEDERKSSRVSQPPGGGSSNIFGGAPDPVATEPAKQKPYLTEAGLFGSGDPTPKKNQARAAPPAGLPAEPKEENSHTNIFGGSEQGQQKTGKAQGAYNPITGAPYATGGSAGGSTDENIVSSTRVRQPPGGASSKLW